MNEILSKDLKELVYLLDAYNTVCLENVYIGTIDIKGLSDDKVNSILTMFSNFFSTLKDIANDERESKSFKEYSDKVNNILNDLSHEEIKDKINLLLPEYANIIVLTDEDQNDLETTDVSDKILKHSTIQ